MKNREIEQRLAQAIAESTPDDLDAILRRVEALKTTEAAPEQAVVFALPGKRKGATYQRWIAAAAALVIVCGAFLGYGALSVDTVVGFDVNPSIEVQLNHFDRVRRVEALNDDAQAILADMDLKNVPLDVAVNAVIGSMLRSGALSKSENAILVSVENSSVGKRERLQQRLVGEIGNLLSANEVSGAIIGQALSEDERLLALAAQYGISLGKAALADTVVSLDSGLQFADIAALPISDIHLLIASQQAELQGIIYIGHANAERYIGEAEAIALALDYAGVEESALSALKVALGYEDSRMVYQIEFSAEAGYLFSIDAVSGNILRYEKEFDMTGQLIGDERAKGIALAHSKLDEDALLSFVMQFDEAGLVYQAAFHTAAMRYQYEIDGVTGTVLSYQWEAAAEAAPSEGSPSPEPAAPSPPPEESAGESAPSAGSAESGDVIGESAAKAIALQDAGVSEAAVSFLYIRQYTRQQARLYEMAFLTETAKHTYEIAAYTGEILAHYTHSVRGSGSDSDSGAGDNQSGDSIGEARAKSIALQHSGASESGIAKFDCQLKSKNNRMVYEIEFEVGEYTYEYLIDAQTGDIIEWEVDD